MKRLQRGMQWFTIVFFSVMLAPACAEKKDAQTAIVNQCLHHLELAMSYLQMRKPDLAIAELKDASKIAPVSAVIQSQLGYAYLTKGDKNEAEKAFGRALDLDPNYGNALYGMALIAMQKQSLDSAIQYLEKSVQAGPPLAERNIQLGVLRLNKRDADGAIAEWKKAIAIDPNNDQAYNDIGGVYLMQEKTDEGIAQIRKALEINPNAADAHNNLGMGLMQGKKDFAQSEAEFRKALQLRPGYTAAWENLGISLFLQKKYADAEKIFQQLADKQPNMVKPHYYLAAIFAINKTGDKAVDQLGKAIALDKSLRVTAKKEPSFESIRNLEGFKKLTE